jgi:hypothetical protein
MRAIDRRRLSLGLGAGEVDGSVYLLTMMGAGLRPGDC